MGTVTNNVDWTFLGKSEVGRQVNGYVPACLEEPVKEKGVNNGGPIMKGLIYEGVYPVFYNDRLDPATEMPMTESLVFSARVLKINDNATHDNKWPD